MKREWLMCVRNPVNNVHPENRFDRLLLFLEDPKSLLVRLEQLLPSKPWPKLPGETRRQMEGEEIVH